MTGTGTTTGREPAVTVRPRHRTVRADGLVVEIDPRLPDAVAGRVVYHSPDDRYLAPAHRHRGTHDLLCLSGRCLVGLWAGQGVRWHRLAAGELIHVPDGVGHRIALSAGSVLAALSSATDWLATTPAEPLPAGGWEAPSCGW